MLIFLLFISHTFAQSYCPSNKVLYCSDWLISQGCSNYYQFNYDYNSAAYGVPPKVCQNGSNGYCTLGTTCMPSCLTRKIGGPNGKICSGFLIQTDCAKYYADHYGDKWCFWQGGVCWEGITCHD